MLVTLNETHGAKIWNRQFIITIGYRSYVFNYIHSSHGCEVWLLNNGTGAAT